MKTQAVRLADVYLLGPFMVWYAATARGMPEWARLAMTAAGVGTILYNGRNYLEARR